MANEQNLISFGDRSPRERREIARKGAEASNKKQREKKMFRETLEILLSMSLSGGKAVDVDNIKNFASIKGKNISVQDAILIAQIQKAMKGDTKAAEYVRDTVEGKPNLKADTGNTSDDGVVIINDV